MKSAARDVYRMKNRRRRPQASTYPWSCDQQRSETQSNEINFHKNCNTDYSQIPVKFEKEYDQDGENTRIFRENPCFLVSLVRLNRYFMPQIQLKIKL